MLYWLLPERPSCRGDVHSDPSTAFPTVQTPDLTTEQMREVDRIMVDGLGIELLEMMENAGSNLAELAIRRYQPPTCTVLAGPGGNGGGGLAAARHLHGRGVRVEVVFPETGSPSPAADHQLGILRRMGVPVAAEPRPAAVVIDALIGYSLRGDPRGRAAELIRWANADPAPILALDVPSGLDTTTGRSGTPCIAADATLTLALPKRGLRLAPEVVGELFAADLGVPPSVYAQLGIAVGAPFASTRIVRVA
jgi:NAD(P)H-hydrate epimerase